MPRTGGSGRVETIDSLRGIASLAVAWFHFTHGNPTFLPPGWLKASGEFGWVGVQVFFVISGCVVPYSMYRARYETSGYWRFVARRIVRLDPPYLVAVLLAVGLTLAASAVPWFAGQPPAYTFRQIALHLGYLNGIFDEPWVNPVFWSLGIEFQYYLFVGAVFPFMVTRHGALRLVVLAGLLIPAFLVERVSLLPTHLPLFAIGILTFQLRAGIITARSYAAGLTAATVTVLATSGVVATLAAATTALVILADPLHGRALTWLGLISYPLYLVHVPVGGKVVNLGTRLAATLPVQLGVLAAAVVASIGAAFLLHRFVELPSQGWSARIAYRKKGAQEGKRA